MDQQFSLRWNNYLNQITSAFGSLRFEEDLVDVTLSCEGKKIKAHKMLLSACSTYFRDIFKENPCQHPVIVFRNVRYADLEAIVDFMYKGEVNVLQDELESFLGTAELLEVKGLTDGSAKEEEELKEMPKILPQSNSLATRQSIRQAHPVSQTPAVSLIPSSRSASPTLKKRRCETSNRLDETLESQRLAVSEISNLPVVPKIEKDYEYVEDLTFDEEDIVLAGVVDPLKSGSKSDDSSGGLQDQQEDSLITMGQMLPVKPGTSLEMQETLESMQAGLNNVPCKQKDVEEVEVKWSTCLKSTEEDFLWKDQTFEGRTLKSGKRKKTSQLLSVKKKQKQTPPPEAIISGRCFCCTWRKNRKSTTRCCDCRFFICREHSAPVRCINCLKAIKIIRNIDSNIYSSEDE